MTTGVEGATRWPTIILAGALSSGPRWLEALLRACICSVRRAPRCSLTLPRICTCTFVRLNESLPGGPVTSDPSPTSYQAAGLNKVREPPSPLGMDGNGSGSN